ncbi:nuclear matrix protein [Histoplasma capsulatum G186AR]|uniref:Nuclear matrix protein n=2 Tax=Ajellomyces capsulatus TaxID=5037 RepID=C0NYN3_AJECG|nr:nuclear matrix protein [Histoplasma capsulatum G186AR]EEH03323.1 nuclear matrix protein [Histoplasma capsulatum G186AR]KAG5295739.1 nuclear matrix protein [Histoplasma capsulatum]QSS73720.1 nuclear matrix protein [Histoplasma capsulatum G186AR]
MAGENIASVKVYRQLVQGLLDKATEIKRDCSIEPPLNDADLGDAIRRIQQDQESGLKEQSQQAQYAVVETAFREKFYDLLATTSIDEPSFIQMWNLLDIVSIFSDNEQCEPGLLFWLIEELLDSQTIDGCRKVFDYLESRRERNTAKHFKQKSLIILRSCNELLRRLSRAEDTVFCGRVFIFLFQSFPLGDRSSVNLRGEFHTENVTTFDELPKAQESSETPMDMDIPEKEITADTKTESAQVTKQEPAGQTTHPAAVESLQISKTDAMKPVESEPNSILSMDDLYPIFWSLQTNFSSPTSLFDPANFAAFKAGLEASLSVFQKVNADMEVRMMKGSEEARRGPKRRRIGDGTEITNSFNPKYLTSRDLFELEVNDVAFRRHILVQSLILLDFVLSLTPKAKAKLADSTNKSVLYNYVLNDEDTKWASQMKTSIATYLQQGSEGKFYYRMVDTVLTRDKNWVRWKAEACPPIEHTPVSIQDYLDTQTSAIKVSTSKRLRSTPLGSLDLNFLMEDKNSSRVDRLKHPDRFSTPALDFYLRGIADDEFNIDMSQSREEKDEAIKAKASKTWRTLRLSSRCKLALFDKIEDGNNLKVLFELPASPEDTPTAANKQKATVENGVNGQEGSSKSTQVKGEEAKENQPPISSDGTAHQQR